MATAPRVRTDGKAIVSLLLALVSLACLPLTPVAAVAATAAVACSLASRRELRRDPLLGGTALSLAGFLIGVGVLVAKVGPLLLATFLFALAAARGA